MILDAVISLLAGWGVVAGVCRLVEVLRARPEALVDTLDLDARARCRARDLERSVIR